MSDYGDYNMKFSLFSITKQKRSNIASCHAVSDEQ